MRLFATIVCVTMVSLIPVLLSISFVSGFDYFRRCLLFNRTCVTHCPKFMHPYHTRCDRDTISQRTCEIPVTYPIGFTCGWSRCDCNGDLLLDEMTYHCVPFESCPAATHRKPEHLRSHKQRKLAKAGRRRQHKRIKVSDADPDLIDLKKK